MKIRRIVLENLHSIQSEVTVDFTAPPLSDAGLFAITGDTGAGKTTILDAITLALYGQVCRKSDVQEVLSYGATEGRAVCEFEARNRRLLAEWRIYQTKSKIPGKKLQVVRSVSEWDPEENGFVILAQRKINEVKNIIDEVTGLDFARFTRSVLLAQGEFAAFLKADHSVRSDLLERITGTEIYSHFSKAAHEKKNEEKNRLDELIASKDALRLLSAEELSQKKRELREYHKTDKANRKELELSKTGIHWLEQVEKLTARKENAESEWAKLQDRKNLLLEDLEKLNLHLKTRDLASVLDRFDEKKQQVLDLEAQIRKLEEKIRDLTPRVLEQENQYGQIELAFDARKKEQPAFFRKLDEVSVLDSKIRERETILQKQKKVLSEQNLALSDQHQKLQALNNELQTLSRAIQDEKIWMEEHKVLADLPKDLPKIRIIRDALRESLITRRELEKQIADSLKKCNIIDEENQRLTCQLESDKQKLAEHSKIFASMAPPDTSLNSFELLEIINHEIEKLQHQETVLTRIRELTDQNRVYLEKKMDLTKELERMQTEWKTRQDSLLQLQEQKKELAKKVQYARDIYHQQLQIANYTKDRANLKEGDPCPLCFSTHHPFRDHKLESFVDRSAEELDLAESSLQSVSEKVMTLQEKQSGVLSIIRTIEDPVTGKLPDLEQRIDTSQQRILELVPELPDPVYHPATGEFDSGQENKLRALIQQKKELRTQLSALNSQRNVLEGKIRETEKHISENKVNTGHLQRTMHHFQNQLIELEKKFDLLTEELNEMAGKYGYRFSMDTARDMFDQLENNEGLFNQKVHECTQLEKQYELTGQRTAQIQESVQILQEQITRLSDELALESDHHKKLTTKRFDLFEEKNTETERERFLSSLEMTDRQLTEARTTLEKTRGELLVAKESLKTQVKQVEKEKVTLLALEKTLHKGVLDNGFSTLDAFRAAILPVTEARRIEQDAEHFKQSEIRLKQTLDTVSADLKTMLEKPATLLDQQQLAQNIHDLEANLRRIQQNIGALQQQLTDNEAKAVETARLLESIEQQRDNFNRWAALHDLIGSSDGKKFRVFAQGLTLQKLVQLANNHLTNLYGRYLITKTPGEDLSLDIVDTYQADNVRSMHTLSGGESFLVSLALALGLSDLAGRNANIKSLFIDEGFGSLDDQTLDLAITTLENLQARGKTIGIISHVKELKERISTQVKVMKKGGGISTVLIEN